VVSVVLVFWMVRITGDLKHKYGYAEIVPAGVPVDLDAAARAQHEAAMGEAAAEPGLVQILPAQGMGPPVATASGGSEAESRKEARNEAPESSVEPPEPRSE
jgi:hypothetical protein